MKRLLSAVALGLVAALTLTGAFAHGGAKLTVEPPAASPGGTIAVSGSGVDAGSEVEVVLQGARGEANLGHADADSTGAFRLETKLPADVPEGSYRLVATAGDEKLELDFSVEARVMTMPGETSVSASSSDAMPRGDGVVYRRTTAETVTAGLVLGLVALLGAGLVFTGRRQEVGA